MFQKRVRYGSSRKYDRAFFVKFLSDLNDAGFDSISIKIPFGEGLQPEGELAPTEFLDRNRNYPSTILVARNLERNDEVKVLFVNMSKKVFFSDDSFPSGFSEPAEICVQSPDPARLIGLTQFFKEYLSGTVDSKRAISVLLFLPALLFVLAEILNLFQKGRLLIQGQGKTLMVFDFLLILLSMVIVASFYSRETGLYIKERDHKALDYIKRAIKGDFRDNALVNFFVAFLGTFLAGVALWFLEKVFSK